PALDFNPSAAQDYLSLAPLLQQGFFIGNGMTAGGIQQRIIIPAGASRFYLGTMDGCCWIDNLGSFTAQVSQAWEVPEPATAVLVGLGLLLVIVVLNRTALLRPFGEADPPVRNG